MYVDGLIVVVFTVFLYSGLRSSLNLLHCFITVFLIICASLWFFTGEVSLRKDAYSNILKNSPPKLKVFR